MRHYDDGRSFGTDELVFKQEDAWLTGKYALCHLLLQLRFKEKLIFLWKAGWVIFYAVSFERHRTSILMLPDGTHA